MKVLVNDTDHSLYYIGLLEAGQAGQRAWAWKNLLRGNCTLFMDPYLLPWTGRNNPRGGQPDPQWEPLRKYLGDTRTYAQRLNLTKAVPSVELATSRYCLAVPGEQYLVYLPEGGALTVDLSAARGDLPVEWFNPATGEAQAGPSVAGGAPRSVSAPFAGDAVVYLAR